MSVLETDKSWEFDDMDDGSLKIVSEVQLRNYKNFLSGHAKGTEKMHHIV